MHSENSKTSNPNRLLLHLSRKLNLKKSDKYDALSHLSIYYTWKNIRKLYIKSIKNQKCQLYSGMINLNDLMDYILHQILKFILTISSKNLKKQLIIRIIIL